MKSFLFYVILRCRGTCMDFVIDAALDTIKIVPFLFMTYLFIEWFEHNASDKLVSIIQKSSKFGPFFGSVVGLIPQCGFSSIASSLYVTRVITLGSLIAIYLSTSDEMLPILISNQASPSLIVTILSLKVVMGMTCGFVIDFMMRKKNKEQVVQIDALCVDGDCRCEEEGILKSAIVHTIRISIYILVISFLLNTIIANVDLKSLLIVSPILTTFLSAIIGLIPNCAASIALTELYMEGLLPFGAMFAGLLTNAGVGLLVLFKINKNNKENMSIVGILLSVGIAVGVIIQLL